MEKKGGWNEAMAPHRARGRGRKTFWVLVLVGGLVLGAGVVKGFGPDRAGAHHGRHTAGLGSPEQIADRIDTLLDHLDATDLQRIRIAAIVEGLTPELARLAAERDTLRERIVEAFAAEELSAPLNESLQLQTAEQTARLTGRTLEIAFEIAAELTPEQRRELIEHWDKR